MKKDIKDVKSNEVSDRRALLKVLVAGSAVVTGFKALPESWSKPLTQSVMLPAHAQSTAAADFDYVAYVNDGEEDQEGDDGYYSESGDESSDNDVPSDAYVAYTTYYDDPTQYNTHCTHNNVPLHATSMDFLPFSLDNILDNIAILTNLVF